MISQIRFQFITTFWYHKIEFVISQNRICDITKSNLWYHKKSLNLWYHKIEFVISQIHICDIINSILWYHKISLNLWYIKFDFVISQILFYDITNSILWYHKFKLILWYQKYGFYSKTAPHTCALRAVEHAILRKPVRVNLISCKNVNFLFKFSDFFSYFCTKHKVWVHVRTASMRRFKRIPTIYVLKRK